MNQPYSPWGDLASREHIDVEHTDDLSDDLEAVTRFRRGEDAGAARKIAIAKRLDRVERRCALAHELAHIDLKHRCIRQQDSPDAQRLADRNEAEADERAARNLIDRYAIVRALRMYGEAPLDQVADELDVTVEVVETWLRAVARHPGQKAWLRAAVMQECGSA